MCYLRASAFICGFLLCVSSAMAEPEAKQLAYEGRGTGLSPRVIELFVPEQTERLTRPDAGWPVVCHVRARGGRAEAQLDALARDLLEAGFAYADVRPDNLKVNPSLKAAVRYLLDNAEGLALDPARVFVLGKGDGAGAAAALAFTAAGPTDDGYGDASTTAINLAGLIVIDGVFDHVAAEHHGAEFLTNDPEHGAPKIIGGNPKASAELLAKQRDRSAMTHFTGAAPPTLIVRDRFDPLIDQSLALGYTLHAAKVPLEVSPAVDDRRVLAFVQRPGPDPDAKPVLLRDWPAPQPYAPADAEDYLAFLRAVEQANALIHAGDYQDAAKLIAGKARELKAPAADPYVRRIRGLATSTNQRQALPEGVVGPAWAQRVGNDAYGTFAEVTVSRQLLRFRWCEPGTMELNRQFGVGAVDQHAATAFDRPLPEYWHGGKHTLAGFWMLEHEMTQELYLALARQRPSAFLGPGQPLERVTHAEAQAFCKQLGRVVDGFNARLPTAYEWQYAALAGVATVKHNTRGGVAEVELDFPLMAIAHHPQAGPGGTPFPLDALGWYWANSDGRAHPIKRKLPNAWGLYDMAGNVSEWTSTPLVPGAGVEDARYFIAKGGSWTSWPGACRAGAIDANPPERRSYFLGFRIVVDPPPPADDE